MEKSYRIGGNKLLAWMLDPLSPSFSEKKSSFHSNWKLAMEAVECIESLDGGIMHVVIDRMLVTIKGEFTDINGKKFQYHWYGGMTSDPKIICLFYGLVEFAKVYCPKQM